ncbi:hypothetical protein PanWU01x14_322060 [Parasponia andersonii]|uniref:Transmembrane protein n=1 Tax=Parasponia andersonii TaxID=3476 RepID=A0A2P5AKZ3_PARAD|nr:hypothetical protein PanWU01x14_322060 [Parasponia andersonii]
MSLCLLTLALTSMFYAPTFLYMQDGVDAKGVPKFIPRTEAFVPYVALATVSFTCSLIPLMTLSWFKSRYGERELLDTWYLTILVVMPLHIGAWSIGALFLLVLHLLHACALDIAYIPLFVGAIEIVLHIICRCYQNSQATDEDNQYVPLTDEENQVAQPRQPHSQGDAAVQSGNQGDAQNQAAQPANEENPNVAPAPATALGNHGPDVGGDL